MDDQRTFGEKIADLIARFGGSWTFIIAFFMFLGIWMWYNTDFCIGKTFDPYPFILLNLFLSCLAAIQAPIIMMSQNRQAARDRRDAKKDLHLSEKIEQEVSVLHEEVKKLDEDIKKEMSHTES